MSDGAGRFVYEGDEWAYGLSEARYRVLGGCGDLAGTWMTDVGEVILEEVLVQDPDAAQGQVPRRRRVTVRDLLDSESWKRVKFGWPDSKSQTKPVPLTVDYEAAAKYWESKAEFWLELYKTSRKELHVLTRDFSRTSSSWKRLENVLLESESRLEDEVRTLRSWAVLGWLFGVACLTLTLTLVS